MWRREQELLGKLSDEEKASLKSLCSCGCSGKIPGDHAEKLMTLGLAELTCGGLGPTSAGRHAVAYQAAH